MKILKLTEGKVFDMGPGNTRRIVGKNVGAKHLTLNYAVFQPYQEFKQHSHARSEDVIVVLKGKGVIKLGDRKVDIQEGDVIYVPPGEQHGTIAGNKEMVLISVQAPPDLDLYKGTYK